MGRIVPANVIHSPPINGGGSMLSRKEKESLYRRKMTELQTRWGNPLDSDWAFVGRMSDEELDESIANTVGQIRFEKGWSIVNGGFALLVGLAAAAWISTRQIELGDWTWLLVVAAVWYVGYALERKLGAIVRRLDQIQKILERT